MRNYKTVHRMYSAWNYQREIDDFNKMSEQGWQLIKGGLFSGRFMRNENVQYRYQMDYQPRIEDKARYIESFREFGWEYINSTFNGWHYFRKLYDPALPEDEYEIFTDRSSLKEMNNRWANLGVGLVVVCFIFAVIELIFMILQPMLPTLVMLVAYVILIAVFIRGIVIMKDPDKSKSRKGDVLFTTLFFLTIIVGMLASNILLNARPGLASNMKASEMNPIPAQLDDALLWNTVEVEYPDFYYIDAVIKADSPITITVADASGEAAYTVTGEDIDEDDVRVRLSRGEYRIYLCDYAGGSLDAEFELR